MQIKEVSKRCGISADTLRYYERIGLLAPIERNSSGIRDFNELDIRVIEFIRCMRSAGIPIEVLKEYFRLIRQGDETIDERKTILQEQRTQLRARIEDLQETLGILDYKISVYEQAMLNHEKAVFQMDE